MKYFVFFSFICLAVVFSAPDCPSSAWLRFRQKCYLGDISKYYSFEENLAFCKSHNASSVSIHSEEENSFLKANLITNRAYWLGVKQVDLNSEAYEWLDGSVYNYSNWIRQVRRTESCAGAVMENGHWYDLYDCKGEWRAFCQIELGTSLSEMLPQISLMLKQQTNQTEIQTNRIKEDFQVLNQTKNESFISWFEDAMIRQAALMDNLSSTFESGMIKKEIQFNNSLAQILLSIRNMHQRISENKLEIDNLMAASVGKWNLDFALFLLNVAILFVTFCVFTYFIISKRKRLQLLRNETNSTNAVLFINNSSIDNSDENFS